MVGAVVLDAAGELAGEGYHERAGEPHAEAKALEQAGPRARGGTLYVTLEPCAHQGRTPPCADAVIRAGIRRAVISILDPDPRTAGEGLARLLEAGIEVQTGVEEKAARRLNEFYLHHRQTGLPFVTAKFAAGLDGRIATRTGDSRWITGEEARAHAHRLRHVHDAILVGSETVLRDDPELTARFEGARQPVRVVLDRRLRTPATARLASRGTLIFTSPGSTGAELEERGVELIRIGTEPRSVLEELGRRGLLSVLVEGGAATLGAFFDAGAVQKVRAYVAPLIIGGAEAKPAIGGLGPARLSEALRLGDVEVERLGPDILVSGYT